MLEVAPVFHSDLKRALQHFLINSFGRTRSLSLFLSLDNYDKNMWPKEQLLQNRSKTTNSLFRPLFLMFLSPSMVGDSPQRS